MLKHLHIRDFLLVQSLDINFDTGLTVITGESGAGKSIILGALGLVLGDRASSDAIRPGCARAEVIAEFDLSDHEQAGTELSEQSLDDPDQPGRALVRRTIGADGRSKAFINGIPVNLRQLRALTAGLVDIHGQQEHQRLAQTEVQLALLDDYGTDPKLLAQCRIAFQSWRDAQRELEQLQAAVSDSEDRKSLLTYQLEELTTTAPQPGEFAEVTREHKRQNQAQELLATVQSALAALDEDATLAQVLKQLERLDDDHATLAAGLETLHSAQSLLEDAARDLQHYERTLEHDPETLASLDARLSELYDLGRKHKVEPDDLPELLQSLSAELDSLSTDRSRLDSLTAQIAELENDFRKLAGKLSRQRRSAAKTFASAVSACMNTLGIPDGRLSLEFSDCVAAHGLESIEFHCVTNPKFPPAPLSRVASGGEQARISLAIQTVAAEKSRLPTLVLDEADVGVGGTTADVVGRLLRSLATHTQVICVTHAPQVAALGQQHMRVHKDSEQDTQIDPLGPEARVEELARMLAGAGITEKSKDYARTLLEDASDNLIH